MLSTPDIPTLSTTLTSSQATIPGLTINNSLSSLHKPRQTKPHFGPPNTKPNQNQKQPTSPVHINSLTDTSNIPSSIKFTLIIYNDQNLRNSQIFSKNEPFSEFYSPKQKERLRQQNSPISSNFSLNYGIRSFHTNRRNSSLKSLNLSNKIRSHLTARIDQT